LFVQLVPYINYSIDAIDLSFSDKHFSDRPEVSWCLKAHSAQIGYIVPHPLRKLIPWHLLQTEGRGWIQTPVFPRSKQVL